MISRFLPNLRGGISGYVLAFALMGVALLIRLLIAPVEVGLQYVTFFPAVAIAAVLGGLGPGLLNTILGIGLATYIFVPPYYSISIEVVEKSFWGNLVFLLDGIVVSTSIEAMHRFRQKFVSELEESKKSALRIQAANEELSARAIEIEKLNIELEKKARAAETANRAKGTFLAKMSHEIRTPLHVIIGLGHMLNRSPANFEKRVNHLCATSQHLLDLINDILDMAKIEEGRLALVESDFTLGEVTDRVQEVLDSLALGKNLILSIEINTALREVKLNGDALRLTQVLINLGNNAIKFSSEGVVTIGISVVEEAESGLLLSFRVRDNGIGIAAEYLEKIFMPFEQAHDSTFSSSGGTGLGLSISQRLVALMGGVIKVESQLGAGSNFSFNITLNRSKVSLEEQRELLLAPVMSGAQVLVAEDYALSLEIIVDFLQDLGCRVDSAVDGIMAVECAKSNAYDLILMDMQMPRMDGLEATRIIRKLPGYRNIPIIALTANVFVEDRQRCLDAGMNDFIGKPMDPGLVAAKLAHWLPGRGAPVEEKLELESPFILALKRIPGLEVDLDWLGSQERLADYSALLNGFVEMHGNEMAQISKLMAVNDQAAALARAHELKATASMIGATRVSSSATDLLQGLDSGEDQTSLLHLLNACEEELLRLTTSVRALPFQQKLHLLQKSI